MSSIEHRGHHARIDACEADAHDAQLAVRVARTEDRDAVDLGKAVQQARCQRLGVLMYLCEPHLLQIRNPLTQSQHGRHIQIPRLVFVRQRVGLAIFITLSPGAPLSQRQQMFLTAGGDVQDAQAGGSQ